MSNYSCVPFVNKYIFNLALLPTEYLNAPIQRKRNIILSSYSCVPFVSQSIFNHFYIPTENFYTLKFCVFNGISSQLFWSQFHLIQDETFKDEFLYRLFFLLVSVHSGTLRSPKSGCSWLDHFNLLHTEQKSNLTFSFFLMFQRKHNRIL